MEKCHAMKAGSTALTQRPRDMVPRGSMLALPDPRRPDSANPPTNFWWFLFLTALARSTCSRLWLDRQPTRNTMLRFWGSSGEIPREEASTLQIGSVTFPPGQFSSCNINSSDSTEDVRHPRRVLLWNPTYGRTKAGWLARTYIQQLYEDTWCGPEDLPEAMNDREKCGERVRDICACGNDMMIVTGKIF